MFIAHKPFFLFLNLLYYGSHAIVFPNPIPILPIAKHASALCSVTILGTYHKRVQSKERSGILTWKKAQENTRQDWSCYVRETEGWLYAVQTLRNAITANTFLATTVLSLLTVISGRIWDIIRTGSPGDIGRNKLILQFVSISSCMLSSAYQFLQSARLMTHAGFMFPITKGTKVDRLVRKSQTCQWTGLRWLYLSLSAIMWTVGGDFLFLLSSIGLVIFFSRIDQPPREVRDIKHGEDYQNEI